ncbi:MAG TPA: cobalt ECF transporter T component CbiQ [Methanothermobacter sp.]|nr:predicted cobalt transport protein [Methanothermobacter sp. MT-2]HHW04514.1 cobalt ECF transporter T component CbiQ [Methanothermobacter sp.]HOK73076.1 cobalt ECF transporter T component CbiQ [Methanothermobacter sp.]HOL69577.1 cobalt ECF transporter T component CbiQ [Methanothermobacter sp.]HPQ04600.1 cobalt ECF transporter T component CbiQ [Methanothermobacter sp.]
MEDLITIERESLKESPVHRLDGRIKIIISLIMIVYAVNTSDLLILFIMEVYLLLLLSFSRIPLSYTLKRLFLILPFGGFIALFQLFIRSGDIIWTGPFGIHVTMQGLLFGILLFSKITVSITAIILLSSTTPMQELTNSMRGMRIPHTFVMLLNLTIRYLFFFYDELERIKNAQKTRCFDIWNKNTGYTWRLRKIGETIAMIFLRAYEQGEKAYLSMLSRGYSQKSQMYHEKSPLKRADILFIIMNITFIILLYYIQISI